MSANTRLGGSGSSGNSVDARSVATSAGAGAVAFVASYLVTFLLWTQTTLPDPETFDQAIDQAFVQSVRDTVPSWKAAGMMLYNAHFVDLTYSTPSTTSSVNLIDAAGGGLVTFALFVPPLFLLLAGFAAVSVSDVTADLPNAVAAGALVLVGYLLFALVGALLFGHTETVEFFGFSGQYILSVPLLSTVVFLGVVYPVVFGGLGGVGAYLLRD
ncbi:hypothetical protein [Haloarchaeobius iranensis]|uniref:DUF7978 domain-containing protein n=1 Tax=Haloarchaeobius iranensis TaxID=996166 RepID=A0A1G9Z1V4_9EURY|nr:hypothetical protein [Haloarchaeobius iranensis]SDN14626.1 hypothetical protein SAMN05192554_11720 [Haloarchaeobius iranensis]